jgi:pimeloyl-ACP methyl ester carboxylesterase
LGQTDDGYPLFGRVLTCLPVTDEYEQDFKAMYPQVEYHEIDNVSHFLMLEIPYAINQMMHDYLENTVYHEKQ